MLDGSDTGGPVAQGTGYAARPGRPGALVSSHVTADLALPDRSRIPRCRRRANAGTHQTTTMTAPVRVYVNGHGVDVPPGASALDAVRAADPEAAARIDAGERALTDSRGLPIAPDAAAYAGAIFRVVSSRQRAGGTSSQ